MSTPDEVDPVTESSTVRDDEAAGPIVFSHHLARRRRTTGPALLHLFSLVAMIAALLALVLYRDRCASQVARVIGIAAQPPPVAPRGSRVGAPDGGR